MKKHVLTIILALTSIFLISCTQPVTLEHITVKGLEQLDTNLSGLNWKNIPLRNVNTGEVFRISDFKGKPVLVETFAVWCPTCTKQQGKIKELHEEVGDEIISVSLDTDPSEDEAKVLEHTTRNGFDWYYAVSPKELTQQLVDEFGIQVVNAPSTPILLICEDQSTRLLRFGVKNADELLEEVEKGC
ncbi:redoxin family protein [Candidatus Woesearchaeota archaeon]|nr:redoxin family protein [Candidatus Woesearchaeota archaeon]